MQTISPRVDIAFKKIFGVEENKDLLISLINAIVGASDQVSDITLLNPYNLQRFRQDKLSILDLKAQGRDGKLFNIEIQISDEANYDKRALYYWAKLYTEQLKNGQGYKELSKAIGIHILNFTSIMDSKAYHNVFNIREKEQNFEYFKDLELHTLELPKFVGTEDEEDPRGLLRKVKTSLDMWMAFLTRHELLHTNTLPAHLDDGVVEKALHVIRVMDFSDEEREMYEGQHKWMMIEADTLEKYKEEGLQQGLKQGLQEGLQQGLQEGLQQGLQEGLKQGQEEGREEGRLEMVYRMIRAGADNSFIEQITEVSSADIEQMRKKLNFKGGEAI